MNRTRYSSPTLNSILFSYSHSRTSSIVTSSPMFTRYTTLRDDSESPARCRAAGQDSDKDLLSYDSDEDNGFHQISWEAGTPAFFPQPLLSVPLSTHSGLIPPSAAIHYQQPDSPYPASYDETTVMDSYEPTSSPRPLSIVLVDCDDQDPITTRKLSGEDLDNTTCKRPRNSYSEVYDYEESTMLRSFQDTSTCGSHSSPARDAYPTLHSSASEIMSSSGDEAFFGASYFFRNSCSPQPFSSELEQDDNPQSPNNESEFDDLPTYHDSVKRLQVRTEINSDAEDLAAEDSPHDFTGNPSSMTKSRSRSMSEYSYRGSSPSPSPSSFSAEYVPSPVKSTNRKRTKAKTTRQPSRRAISANSHSSESRSPSLPRMPLPAPIVDNNVQKRSRGRHVPVSHSSAIEEGKVVKVKGGVKRACASRPYVCIAPGCGKTFGRGEHLKRHVRSLHTSARPYECPVEGCQKTFTRRDNLGQHVKTHI